MTAAEPSTPLKPPVPPEPPVSGPPVPPEPPAPPAVPPPGPPTPETEQSGRRPALLAALVAGLLAAAVIPGTSRPGAGVVLCTVIALGPAVVAAGRMGRVRGSLLVVTGGLVLVPVLRDSPWLVLSCGVMATVLALVVLLDARRWTGFASTVPLLGVATAKAPLWAKDDVPTLRITPATGLAWLRGLVVAAVVVPIVVALLASSDSLFATFIGRLAGRADIDLVPAQAGTLVGVAALSLGATYAAGTLRRSREWAPDRQWRVNPSRSRHPAEWLLPLVLTSVVLAAFIAVQITALFGGDDLIRRETGLTYADRAHQGFGQLIAVTLLMAGLLSWAGRAAVAAAPGQAAHRRLLVLAGGPLLALTVLLAVSALRRLWLYQTAYGWTVRRLLAGCVEIWLAAVLIGLALLWLAQRADLVPRMVAGSAGLGMLLLALAGPDAIVARADVIRYHDTGDWDIDYISRLSADAVPALDGLPEPLRSESLRAWRIERLLATGSAESADLHETWSSWNVARWRAAQVDALP